MTDPAVKRAYLGDVNYYRLVYQLAAQLANGALHRRSLRDPSSGLALQGEEAPNLERAERLISDAEAMLTWFTEKTQPRRFLWLFRRKPKLEPKEERLRRFLDETLVPSTQLLIAGALAYLDEPERAEKYAARARERVDRGAVSYRVHYNFACYEVARYRPPVVRGLPHGRPLARHRPAEPKTFEAALHALRTALRLARGRSRRELVRWAQEDPALHPLREHKASKERFDTLVSRFELPEPKPAKPARTRRRVSKKDGDDAPRRRSSGSSSNG